MVVAGRRRDNPTDQWATEVLGRWLYDWRTRTGVSQRRVAQLAGIDQGGLSRIEHGQGRPSGFRLARIIITLDWLSGGGVPGGPWERTHVERPWRIGDLEPRPPAVVGVPSQRVPQPNSYGDDGARSHDPRIASPP
jgi:hypothetical protein